MRVGRIERMFELFADAELIDAMGECTRDESAMIAQRLAAVGELDARRARELAECRFWRTDPFEEVAAEISAAQNISRGRARGQIHMARVLRDELPAVAAVFATGEIDYRLVDIVISRTENVAAERKRDLDAAVARHCRKWMRLSKPKLRDRVDLWVTKFDPDAVRVPPEVKDNRYVETGETSPGMTGIWANLNAADAAVFDARVDALAATVCDKDPRTKQQRRADAVAPLARYEATLACRCGSPDCPAAAERAAVSAVVIHVLAEQATLEGASDHPGYLPGYGILPAESVRELAADGRDSHAADHAQRSMRERLPPDRSAGGVHQMAGSDVPLPGLRQTGPGLRYRPHQALPVRRDASVEQQAVLPHPSPAEDLLRRVRLEGAAVPQRCRGVHRADGAHLHHRTPRRCTVSRAGPAHRRPARCARARRVSAPRRDDAHPPPDPRTRPSRPHHQRTQRTTRTQQTNPPRRIEASSMARRQRKTATLLTGFSNSLPV